MDLTKQVEDTPLLRDWDIPAGGLNVCCMAMNDNRVLLENFLAEYPDIKARILLVPDFHQAASRQIHLRTANGLAVIPVNGLEVVNSLPKDWKKVILCPGGNFSTSIAAVLGCFLEQRGIRDACLYMPHGAGRFGVRTPLPDYYAKNAVKLQEVYALLADDSSRQTLAARIKALETGKAGYLPISAHQEYFHPLIHPEEGDIMFDGGVSDMVGSQEAFAQIIGQSGRIFGFEPLPNMAAIAGKRLAAYPCYSLQAAGLCEKPCRLPFTYLRDSSHISANADAPDTVLCEMTSVDAFAEERGLKRVDCIKLDVEGAEMAALAGSRETILKHKPKLIICLYHTPAHLFEIPLFVHELSPDYEMYVSHSSSVFTDTILYARVPRK